MASTYRPWFLAGLALLVACSGDGPTGPGPVATVTVAPIPDTLRALGSTVQLSATAHDASGNALTGRTVSWSSDAPEVVSVNALTGVATALANGSAAVTATVDGEIGEATVVVEQAVAAVEVSPATFTLTTLNATQLFTATARDGNDSVVVGVRFLWLSSDQSVATVDTNGLARANGAGSTAITAAALGVPGNAALSVNPTATALVITVQASDLTAGGSISPAVEVEIRDAGGSRVTDARNAVTIALDENPGSATLRGTTTVNAINGIASFSGLSLTKASTGYTLSVTAAGIVPASTDSFDVTAGPASRIAFTTQPSDADAGIPIGISAEIQDAWGNVVPDAGGSVALSLGVNPTNTTLYTGTSSQATVTQAVVGGVADFSAVRIRRAGSGYLLQATRAGMDPALSTFFAVHHGPPYAMTELVTQASGSVSLPLLEIPVAVSDSTGNLTTDLQVPVTVSIRRDPWTTDSVRRTRLLGTTTVLTDSGVARFTNLRVPRPTGDGLSYSLQATAPGTFDAVINFNLRMGMPTLAPIGAGHNHSCASTETFLVYCWGNDSTLQLGRAAGATQADSVAAEVFGLPSSAGFSLVGGVAHTCALRASTEAWCWGDNSVSQLGRGTIGTPDSLPAPVSGGNAFQSLSAGRAHTCGVTLSGEAYCWGFNSHGQLGNNTSGGSSSTPVLVSGGHTWVTIAAGGTHTCGTTLTFEAYCWGNNASGQLGDSTTTDRLVPTLVTKSLNHYLIAAGGEHTCSVADTTTGVLTWCWGNNSDGQLGITVTGGTRSAPARLLLPGGPGAVLVQEMVAGERHTCVSSTGTIPGALCWGDNEFGQLGNGNSPTDANTPTFVQFSAVQGVLGLAAGAFHTCARAQGGATTSGNVYCFGRNQLGQLGDGSRTNRSLPRRIIQ